MCGGTASGLGPLMDAQRVSAGATEQSKTHSCATLAGGGVRESPLALPATFSALRGSASSQARDPARVWTAGVERRRSTSARQWLLIEIHDEQTSARGSLSSQVRRQESTRGLRHYRGCADSRHVSAVGIRAIRLQLSRCCPWWRISRAEVSLGTMAATSSNASVPSIHHCPAEDWLGSAAPGTTTSEFARAGGFHTLVQMFCRTSHRGKI